MTGFRGLLAFGVFMHHSFIWSHYAHGLGWRDSEGFRQFGESRVVLFFMLTTTLFYGRLIDSRGRKLDWLKLYVSRILRLGPAYWVAMSLMFARGGLRDAAPHRPRRHRHPPLRLGRDPAAVLRGLDGLLDAGHARDRRLLRHARSSPPP